MGLGNLHGISLQGLTPRKIPGVPDQSPGPDLNLGLDPEEVLEDVTQGPIPALAPIGHPEAGLTVIRVMLEIGQILIPTVVLEYLG